MPEFLNLLPPQIALKNFIDAIPQEVLNSFRMRSEMINSPNALGRVTACSIRTTECLPPFARSTVDGYAVRAADTFGASESLPAYLNLFKEIKMGEEVRFELSPGKCAQIHTGGMLPIGADAVVMVENTQLAQMTEVEILRAVAVGENVLHAGEDIKPGDEIIQAGKKIGAAEIGGLMGLGLLEIEVMPYPIIGIISTGDEIVHPSINILPGQIRDINTYSLSALVQDWGGVPKQYGIVADQLIELTKIVSKALQECDIVVITAGSSASTRDLTADAINSLGEPGVLVHGVNVRPGKPTILGICSGTPVIGLPGNPVSALVIADIFLPPIINCFLGVGRDFSKFSSVSARLTINLSSQSGREDWIPVKLNLIENEYFAEPVFGKSNLIFTLVRADGIIRISPDATGIAAGSLVKVFLF